MTDELRSLLGDDDALGKRVARQLLATDVALRAALIALVERGEPRTA